MIKDKLEEQIIKRIITRSDSIDILMDYYDDEDVINIYIFDIIAFILNDSRKRIRKLEATEKTDSLILSLLLASDESNEVEIKCSQLKDFVKVIDNYDFSAEILDILQRIFIYNEMLLNYDYQLNYNDISISKRLKLSEDLYNAKRGMNNLFVKLKSYLQYNTELKKDVIFYKLKDVVNNIDVLEKIIANQEKEQMIVKPKK